MVGKEMAIDLPYLFVAVPTMKRHDITTASVISN